MHRRRFWNGFAAGIATGVGATVGTLIAVNAIGNARHGRVVRLQKSLQIGRPVEEVFNAWAELEHLPQWSSVIRSISRHGDRSHWVVDIGGKTMSWDAEVEQHIPNQAIGWKSLNGPKHTGRISFSPLGNDTWVNVTMNYAPPTRLLRPFAASANERIEDYIDQVLREFKAALESNKGGAIRTGSGVSPAGVTGSRATGTFGPETGGSQLREQPRHGGGTNPVDYTRPPESRS